MTERKHILICGEVGVGKSTLIQRLLAQNTSPLYGFITKKLDPDENGFHPISPQSWRKACIRPTVAAKKAMLMPINSRSCMKISPSGSKFFRIQEGVAQINEQAER